MGVYQSISYKDSVRMHPVIKLDMLKFKPVALPTVIVAWSWDEDLIINPIKNVAKASDNRLRYRGNVPFMPLDSPDHSQK